jgi:hypothetical protein
MAASGCPEFVLTWKHWDMSSGPPICALRGRQRKERDGLCVGVISPASEPTSEHPTSDSVSSGEQLSPPGLSAIDRNSRPLNEVAQLAGWPTPDAHRHGEIQDEESLNRRLEGIKASGSAKRQFNLQDAVQLAYWPTPQASDDKATSGGHGRETNPSLRVCAGWATPTANDSRGSRNETSGRKEGGRPPLRPDPLRPGGFWGDCEIVLCRDEKARRVEPGTFPLAAIVPRRVGPLLPFLAELGIDRERATQLAREYGANRRTRLKGYGNAIVPQVAAEFVKAFMESVAEASCS